MTSIRLTGVLDDYFETGCEGTYWSLYLDDPENVATSPYQRLFILEKGDHLEIYNVDGLLITTVDIDPDYEVGYAPYPANPSLGQPLALGRWIHWTQKGWTPDDWARLFIPEIPATDYEERLIQTFRDHNASDLLERYQNSGSIRLPDPDFDRYCQLQWIAIASFKNRGIVTRTIPGTGGSYLNSEEREVYLSYVRDIFSEAGRTDLLDGPISDNRGYFERDRLMQIAMQRFRASCKK